MKKIKRRREYQVSIPYTHVFVVEAFNKKDALKQAHASCNGEIADYDDSKAEIEEGPYVD